jgi:hypothetical protein
MYPDFLEFQPLQKNPGRDILWKHSAGQLVHPSRCRLGLRQEALTLLVFLTVNLTARKPLGEDLERGL